MRRLGATLALVLAASVPAPASAEEWRRHDPTPGCMDREEFLSDAWAYEVDTRAEARRWLRQRGWPMPLGSSSFGGVTYADPDRYQRRGYRGCDGARVRIIFERPRALHPHAWWWVYMTYRAPGSEAARTVGDSP